MTTLKEVAWNSDCENKSSFGNKILSRINYYRHGHKLPGKAKHHWKRQAVCDKMN